MQPHSVLCIEVLDIPITLTFDFNKATHSGQIQGFEDPSVILKCPDPGNPAKNSVVIKELESLTYNTLTYSMCLRECSVRRKHLVKNLSLAKPMGAGLRNQSNRMTVLKGALGRSITVLGGLFRGQ